MMIILIISTPNSHLLSIKYVDDNWLKKLKCTSTPQVIIYFFLHPIKMKLLKKEIERLLNNQKRKLNFFELKFTVKKNKKKFSETLVVKKKN